MKTYNLSANESEFLKALRSLSILVIVLGHTGVFWFYRPITEFLHVFVPVFFFISGAVSLFSFRRSKNVLYYYKKRFFKLLVPYYMLCMLAVIVFFIKKTTLPELDLVNFNQWMQLRPSEGLMPFPVGQVWFLHTLFFIILFSPVYFLLNDFNKCFPVALMLLCIFVSGIQLFYDIDNNFYIYGNNLFKPVVHSAFFIFGMLTYSSLYKLTKNYYLLATICLLFFTLFLACIFRLDIDYANHTFAPDIYYVSGSFATICFFMYVRESFFNILRNSQLINKIVDFLHNNTMSIFLLHSFSIYLLEELFNMVHPSANIILYGIAKIFFVIVITLIISVPFSRVSNFTVKELMKI